MQLEGLPSGAATGAVPDWSNPHIARGVDDTGSCTPNALNTLLDSEAMRSKYLVYINTLQL
ncbi:hypothetical protein SCP_0401200 [Sparassis crispa]|uniref:Uncharacterized protein n=1 Tax=Sparassis crispa TaxID=139825 RepID=A0A401GHW6_9APHY|nr:hypothetical protein SCP_0401200 [Sparassis crispa]GBE81748.1 hypothetical protein SCP_0401200 [Sparassis crispa]